MKEQSTKIIKQLIQTEKSDRLSQMRKYVFIVDSKANKLSIQRALPHKYPDQKFSIEHVRTMVMKPKRKRAKGKGRPGRTSSYKKAIVTLSEGCKINIEK